MCFNEVASSSTETCYNNRETSSEDESCRIMTTSQRWWWRRFEQFIITNRNILFHSKWKIQKQSVQHFLPACLQAFLISNDPKSVGIGHTLTQAVRHRSVIAPIVVGLGVWCGAGVRFEMVSRSAEFLVFLNFIRRGFFLRTLLFGPDHCELSADNSDSNNHQWIGHISQGGYHPLIMVQT